MASIFWEYRIAWVAALTLLSWIGEVIHNAVELPQLSILSPENSIPALMGMVLFIGYWKLPNRKTWRTLLLLWAGIHLVFGAVLSVLPLPFLPFEPEQSITHYFSHIIYGAAQTPMIIFIWRN